MYSYLCIILDKRRHVITYLFLLTFSKSTRNLERCLQRHSHTSTLNDPLYWKHRNSGWCWICGSPKLPKHMLRCRGNGSGSQVTLSRRFQMSRFHRKNLYEYRKSDRYSNNRDTAIDIWLTGTSQRTRHRCWIETMPKVKNRKKGLYIILIIS